MHNAPSVSYPVGRSFWAGLLAATLVLSGALVTTGWLAQAPVGGWRIGAAATALALGAAAAGWNWWRMPQGTLAWDGHDWAWTAAAGTDTGRVEPCVDLQSFLLLRFAGQPGSHWLWLERRRCAERWDDLRRAVYSRARSRSLPGGQAGAAEP
jgi:toxin CptA